MVYRAGGSILLGGKQECGCLEEDIAERLARGSLRSRSIFQDMSGLFFFAS